MKKIKISGLEGSVTGNTVTPVYFFVAGEFSYLCTAALRLVP
jgi:hypothetical protein